MRRLALVPAVLALVALWAPSANAQAMTEQQKNEAYMRAFVAGLEVLTDRRLQDAERLFSECIRLYPNRPVAHYNLACAYSLGGKTQKAVEELRSSFRLGWHDLAHMSRDMDLDPIRKSAAFRKAFSDFSSELLTGAQPVLYAEPAGQEKYPLLVYVTNFGGSPDKELSVLSQAMGTWGIAVTRGVVQNPRRDDSSAEFRLTHAVREALDAHPRADRRQVYVVGEGAAGNLVLTATAHNPDLFKAVLAAGPNLGPAVEDVELEGTRAYLVVHKNDPAQIVSGEAARNAFAKAGSPVVLERYPLATPFSSDRALLLRGVSWLRGQKVSLPGAGEAKPF